MDHQQLILETIEEDTKTVSLNRYNPDYRHVRLSYSMRFGNTGRLIAHHPADLRTLATLDFDFQPRTVHASIDECVQIGQPTLGPRRTGIYHWQPGLPADDQEIARLRADWLTAIKKAVIAGLSDKHAEYYRKIEEENS